MNEHSPKRPPTLLGMRERADLLGGTLEVQREKERAHAYLFN